MVPMVSASEDAAEGAGGCLVLVLKETEAEDLLAASSLTALLSPDMGGHLGIGRWGCRFNIFKLLVSGLSFIVPLQKISKHIEDCGFNFIFPLS